jgi:YopX protein
MRTIKVRGQLADSGEWEYIYLLSSPDKTTAAVMYEVFTYGVNPKTVGQFIGLHDCEGNEIYEGDIVMVDNTLACEVSWNNSIAAYCLMRNGEMYHGVFPIYPKLIRLVGNIYDNPELIQ